MTDTLKIPQFEPLDFARKFQYVREADANNTGLRVEAIQRWSGATPGTPESWCADFVSFCNDVAYQGDYYFPRYRSVAEYIEAARQDGFLVSADDAKNDRVPVPGRDLFCIHDATESHIGFVAQFMPCTGQFSGLSGNTSTADGKQGVAEHKDMTLKTAYSFILIPRN